MLSTYEEDLRKQFHIVTEEIDAFMEEYEVHAFSFDQIQMLMRATVFERCRSNQKDDVPYRRLV